MDRDVNRNQIGWILNGGFDQGESTDVQKGEELSLTVTAHSFSTHEAKRFHLKLSLVTRRKGVVVCIHVPLA